MSSTPPPSPDGQPPQGQPPQGQPAYGQPPYGAVPPAAWVRPPDHPKAQTVLVLGILALVLCQVIGPFAWSQGNAVLREIDASGGRVGGRETANVGRILGIVSTVLLIVGLVLFVGIVVLQLAILGGGLAFG